MTMNSTQKLPDNVRQYLIHSYLYYVMNTSVISDYEFDKLCKELLDSGIEHPLMSREDLAAGTGYNIKDYPADIIEEAKNLASITSKPAAGDIKKPKELEFNGHPMETYLLLGMYIDCGYHKSRDGQKVVQAELQRRWSAGMHRSEFEAYFKSWGFGPERFGLS